MKQMTEKESLESYIKMKPIFINLTNDEKDADTYKEKINLELVNICEEYCKISSILFPIMPGTNLNICQEKEFKETLFDKLDVIKKRFNYYKKSEISTIDANINLEVSTKKKFATAINDAVKNKFLKMDIVQRQFQEDIEKIDDELQKGHFKNIEGPEFALRKEQVRQMRRDIEDYCRKVICNDTDLLKTKSLKNLSKSYTPIFEKALVENAAAINDAITNSNISLIAELLLASINENIKLEKSRILQNI